MRIDEAAKLCVDEETDIKLEGNRYRFCGDLMRVGFSGVVDAKADFTYFMATTDQWEPWEEPREYVSFDKAQEQMSMALGLQHSKFPDKGRIWSGSSSGTIWEMPKCQEAGEVIKVVSIPVEYLSPEWYVVASILPPKPKIPSIEAQETEEMTTWANCPDCGTLSQMVDDEYFCTECQSPWIVEPIEPVFDLTYEEAKYISGNDLLKVKCEVFVNGMRWKRSRGEWHDMHGNRIADVAPWLKLKKWRVVTD